MAKQTPKIVTPKPGDLPKPIKVQPPTDITNVRGDTIIIDMK